MSKLAQQLIDALEPAQRAVLHEALINYQETQQICHARAPQVITVPNLLEHTRKIIRYRQDHAKQLIETLFAECFIDDLNVDRFANAAAL